MTLTPGANFGPYRVIEAIGRGGMASVYKVYEAALDRFVALKVLPAEFLHEPSFAARFEREAKVIAKLEHPNIIPIFAFGIEQGIPWMSMRLIGGGSLSGMLKGKSLPRARTVEVIRSVADALTYAHSQGVVHRDVKPHNILVDEHGRVYLADFGIARIVEGGPAITRTGMVSGTPQYMAPEQATGQQPIDHRLDIYALGIVTFELLTGSAPFTADTPVAVLMKQVSAPIPIPSPELVPQSMLGPLMKCLAKSPDERWATAVEFADALQRGMATATVTVPPPTLVTPETLVPPAPTPTARRPVPAKPEPAGRSVLPWVLLGLGVVAVAGMLLGLWLWRGTQTAQAPSAAPTIVPTALPAPPSPSPAPTAATTEARAETPTPAPANASPRAAATPAPATPHPAHATPESKSLAPTASATATTPTPTPAAPAEVPRPAAPTPAATTPTRPAGHPFKLNEKIDAGSPVVGLVTLLHVRFTTKPDEIEAALEFHCAKGHDQAVTAEVVIYDEAGNVLVTLGGKKKVEEKDNGTVKAKKKIAPGLLDAAKSFRVSFTTVED